MAIKQFYHDIDLVNEGQLVGARKNSLTTAERITLGGMLGVENEALFVWDKTEKMGYTWTGTQWQPEAVQMDGDILFKGELDASIPIDDGSQPQVVEPVSGYQYVVVATGTFDAGATGVTLTGEQTLRPGDQVLFTSTTTAVAIQRNIDSATQTTEGKVRLATQTEVNDGDANGDPAAITPETLQARLDDAGYVVQYFETVNVVAGTPLTVNHNLDLTNQDAFTFNAMLGNSQVSLDVDSVDANSITITSLVALNDVSVTIQGVTSV